MLIQERRYTVYFIIIKKTSYGGESLRSSDREETNLSIPKKGDKRKENGREKERTCIIYICPSLYIEEQGMYTIIFFLFLSVVEPRI